MKQAHWTISLSRLWPLGILSAIRKHTLAIVQDSGLTDPCLMWGSYSGTVACVYHVNMLRPLIFPAFKLRSFAYPSPDKVRGCPNSVHHMHYSPIAHTSSSISLCLDDIMCRIIAPAAVASSKAQSVAVQVSSVYRLHYPQQRQG